MKGSRILVCNGKDCRKKTKYHRKLQEALAESGEVEHIGCQKICSGPVVGIQVKGTWQWFAKVRKADDRKAIRRVIRSGKLAGRARGMRVKKRAGKLR